MKYLFSMYAAWILFLVIVIGCSTADRKELTPQFYRPFMLTVVHDGHKFIWAERDHSGQFLHHPDCPCHTDPLSIEVQVPE